MSIPREIIEFLDSRQVRYQRLTHSPAYTAQEIAHAQHVSGKELAKAVMIIADNRLAMAVLPASHRVELSRLGRLLGARAIRLAREDEFEKVFPGCELGAMPPLGNLYHVDVWVDQSLKKRPTIVFNAGTHAETIQMSFADFERVVQPHLGEFAALTREGKIEAERSQSESV